jgi:hypothetical protein
MKSSLRFSTIDILIDLNHLAQESDDAEMARERLSRERNSTF